MLSTIITIQYVNLTNYSQFPFYRHFSSCLFSVVMLLLWTGPLYFSHFSSTNVCIVLRSEHCCAAGFCRNILENPSIVHAGSLSHRHVLLTHFHWTEPLSMLLVPCFSYNEVQMSAVKKKKLPYCTVHSSLYLKIHHFVYLEKQTIIKVSGELIWKMLML